MKIIKWQSGMTPEAGKCYSGMPNNIYHGFRDWHGSTTIKHALRSAESFFYEIAQPSRNSIALERGHAFHAGIESLAADGTLSLFEAEVIECPTKTVDSKAWKELKAANPEMAVLPVDEIEKARTIAEKLFEKASEANYFDEGWPELSFFWIDEETRIQLKCRPDWIRIDGQGWMPDYKTSKAHYLEAFAREIANYNYHLSAAIYLEGVRAVTGINIENWHFLVAANTPPFEVEAYELDERSKKEGHLLFRKCLETVKNYRPVVALKPRVISLPGWAFKLTEF